jgi:hypothetical protein
MRYRLMLGCEDGHQARTDSNPVFFSINSRLLLVLILVFLPHLLWCQAQSVISTTDNTPDIIFRRIEIGGQATDMRLSTCFGTSAAGTCSTPQFAVGPGVALNIKRYLAIDGEFNFLTGVDHAPAYFEDGSVAGGRASELLVGLRLEKRARHYGYFLVAKPGFVTWSQAVTGVVVSQSGSGSTTETLVTGRRDFFATEVGEGVEYSPTANLHLRFEIGDLLVRYNDSGSVYCNSCVNLTNNLQTSAGAYFGLGNLTSWSPSARDSGKEHKFFGKSNLVLMGVSLLGQAADAYTTQRNVSHGGREGDPLAEPFVKYGWSGQIGLGVLNNAAEILGMYGLHKIGAHWIERAVPLSIATASGIEAYRNDRSY